MKLPAGFRLELVACGTARSTSRPASVGTSAGGSSFAELHGYNLEGQYDIEELNKTGKLDRVVRRLDADEKIKERARAKCTAP